MGRHQPLGQAAHGRVQRGPAGRLPLDQAQGIDPLFEFGHGLSYTDFAYDHVRVTPRSTDGEREMRAGFRVTNTGDRAGTEIAQVYLELPASADEPSKRLVGWAKVDLKPGAHENVTITCYADELETRHLLEHRDESGGGRVTPSGT